MRTLVFLLAGCLLLTVCALLSRQFAEYFRAASWFGTLSFLALWLAISAFNMWVGVSKAGYAASEELPIFLLLFGVPAALALIVKWKLI